MDIAVLISTFNRSALLAATVESLGAMHVPAGLRWEVIVVDNRSTDATREVAKSRQVMFPVPLRYLYEGRQGKSHGLNTGLAATEARVIVATDDDVRVDRGWLAAAARPLLERPDIHYTGGPVLPLWEVPPPAWCEAPSMRGPLALLDYGDESFVFEDRRLIPLGVNMALSRVAIDRVGGFHPAMDRRGTSLLGQGQAEFFFRTRAAGLKGLYVPSMRVRHHVPASRMTERYFRRWWYWKGVARARIERWHSVSELGVDLSTVPRVLELPRYMWRSAAQDVGGWLSATVRRDTVRRMEREVTLAYFAGYFAGRREGAGAHGSAAPPVPPAHGRGAGLSAQPHIGEL